MIDYNQSSVATLVQWSAIQSSANFKPGITWSEVGSASIVDQSLQVEYFFWSAPADTNIGPGFHCSSRFFKWHNPVWTSYKLTGTNREPIHSQGKQLCQNRLPPFWKGVYSKRKEFAPLVSKFFPFSADFFSEGRWSKFFPPRVDPFSERVCCVGKQTGNHKSCPFF